MTPTQLKAEMAQGLRKRPKKRELSEGEETMALQLKALKIPFEREVMFYNPHRTWRFDFVITGTKFALEIEGAIWSNGRHTRGSGWEKDAEKYNTAAACDWKVFRFSTGMVKKGEAIKFLQRIKAIMEIAK